MAKPNVVSKETLLEAAKQCLVERGMQKFTLRAVAETGGVTQGTVYYHFRTKEQLLIDLATDVCDHLLNEIDNQQVEEDSGHALESALNHCLSDAFHHKLIVTLIVIGFNNPQVAEQMGRLIDYENNTLTNNLMAHWSKSPIKGVSMETWGILLNAMIDGLALKALQTENFSIGDVYNEIEILIKGLGKLAKEPEKQTGFGMLKRNSLF